MSEDTRNPRPDQTIQVDTKDVELAELAPRSSRRTPPPLPPMEAQPVITAPVVVPPAMPLVTLPPPAPAGAGGRIVLGVVFTALLAAAIGAGLFVGKSVRKPVAGAVPSGSVSATGAVFSAAIPVSASAKTLEIPMVEVSGP